eukprot:TRINITY_DN1177_c0_g1_i1.p1 TRINITY_DN1177_c0_g1~~TRINITY_DN1177_c0_g1_i1.p1  ORF type:complete len:306 (-),score=86.65 TRINITY_DN1177_c0_g1_i1:199-1116(-)
MALPFPRRLLSALWHKICSHDAKTSGMSISTLLSLASIYRSNPTLEASCALIPAGERALMEEVFATARAELAFESSMDGGHVPSPDVLRGAVLEVARETVHEVDTLGCSIALAGIVAIAGIVVCLRKLHASRLNDILQDAVQTQEKRDEWDACVAVIHSDTADLPQVLSALSNVQATLGSIRALVDNARRAKDKADDAAQSARTWTIVGGTATLLMGFGTWGLWNALSVPARYIALGATGAVATGTAVTALHLNDYQKIREHMDLTESFFIEYEAILKSAERRGIDRTVDMQFNTLTPAPAVAPS